MKLKNVVYGTVLAGLFGFNVSSSQQIVTGKVVNSGVGLEGKTVQVFAGDKTAKTTTGPDGSFVINSDLTGVVEYDSGVPSDFSVSNNYPNPFNPKTLVDVKTPKTVNAKLDVFNILGQNVQTAYDGELHPGTSTLDVNLDGMPGGVYFLRANVGDKSFVKKLLLVYGSQHANSGEVIKSGNVPSVKKVSSDVTLDSVLVSGQSILKKKFNNSTPFTEAMDLGDLPVDSAFNIFGRVPKLMDWDSTYGAKWLGAPDTAFLSNAEIIIAGIKGMSDSLGYFNLQIPKVQDTVDVDITQSIAYPRKTRLDVKGDTEYYPDMVDTLNFPSIAMEFYNYVYTRKALISDTSTGRWFVQPRLYMVGDTTTAGDKAKYDKLNQMISDYVEPLFVTPLYPEGFLKNFKLDSGPDTVQYNGGVGQWHNYILKFDPLATGIAALTDMDNGTFVPDPVHGRWPSGKEIVGARTRYSTNSSLEPVPLLDYATVHELITGLCLAYGRRDDLPSAMNLGNVDTRYGTIWDTRMTRFQYSRSGGCRIPDSDQGRR